MTDYRDAALVALDSIRHRGPVDLLGEIHFQSRRGSSMSSADRRAVLAMLLDNAGGNPLHVKFRHLVFDFDNARRNGGNEWAGATNPNSAERRALVCSLLKLTAEEVKLLTETLPFTECGTPLVVSEKHEDWLHTDAERARREFFFERYLELLRKRGWSNYSVDSLRRSTEAILEAVSSPTRREAYQSRGLVMGYVQSGKTSNFAGLIARAADHGYRLFIILAGTMNILRNQTQRRIDKDIIGRELLTEEECYRYLSREDWKSFISYGDRPAHLGAHDWVRLTSLGNDYQQLKAGAFQILRPEKEIQGKPLYDPGNLFSSRLGCRILIVKKHHDVIGKLLNDFRKIQNTQKGLIEELPTMIVDDESDQASLDTRKPDAKETEQRRAVNRKVTELVNFFPRGQYVGYTATPYAHVLVDKEDTVDLFPKDFIVSLPKPPEDYMGVYDFFESDPVRLAGGGANKETSFIRKIDGENADRDNLPLALTAFVLSGAIKLYRMSVDASVYKYRHHTMLIHTSVQRSQHRSLALEVWKEFNKCGFNTVIGQKLLEKMWEYDYKPVSAMEGRGLPLPSSYAALKPFVTECLRRIEADSEEIELEGQVMNLPIFVVNSDTDQAPDFEAEKPVWKIIVGGSKLSRGYTIEDLTVSYYRRTAKPGDTLMQMGRWFGFRKGYRDLVRLFIGTDEPIGKKGVMKMNLVERFRSLCRTEEALRIELERYIRRSGAARVTPKDIPPLIRLFDDRDITSKNKQYYAECLNKNYGGSAKESTQAPNPESTSAETKVRISANQKAARKLLDGLDLNTGKLGGKLGSGEPVSFDAIHAISSQKRLLEFLKAYNWNQEVPPDVSYQIDFLEREKHGITEWLIIAPQRSTSFGNGDFLAGGKSLKVKERAWMETRFGVYSESSHVATGKFIAGIADNDAISLKTANKDTLALCRKGRGVVLLYPVRDRENGPISIGFVLIYPENNLGFLKTISARGSI